MSPSEVSSSVSRPSERDTGSSYPDFLAWQFATLRAPKLVMEKVFTQIYRRNVWGDPESVSGPGSSLMQTSVIREELPNLVSQICAKSLLDIPCGDFNWMKEVDLNLDLYIGADIVDELIAFNNLHFANTNRYFVKLDLTKNPLPAVDLIFCRDCLVHFSLFDILRALKNIKESGSKYLLTTTFTSVESNLEMVTGGWRPLNFQKMPFCFPEPLKIVNESCPTIGFADKSLGLWRIDDIDPNQIYLNLILEEVMACDRLLMTNSDNSVAIGNKGQALARLGDWQVQLGKSREGLQSYSQALSCYTRILSLFPDHYNAHYYKGNLLQKCGSLQVHLVQEVEADRSFREAIASYTLALFFAPDLVEAHYNKGLALINLANLQSKFSQQQAAFNYWEAGLASLNHSLALAPNNPSIREVRDRLQGFLEESKVKSASLG